MNTTVRIEYVPGVEPRGLGIEFIFTKIFYHGDEQVNEDAYEGDEDEGGKVKEILKKISFEDVKISTDFFRFTPKQHASMQESRRVDSGDDSSGSTADSKDDDNELEEEEEEKEKEKEKEEEPIIQLASFNGSQALIMKIKGTWYC